ncbi:MAG: cell division protein ZipA C-terminal FtsZ-binding domain-containing protein [Rhodocyclaceae bacterium]|jgi:hypothetical protein|nr:cell division protein ZipA C-terminal FtsZ-binding domain-containing protein [Rhodocyclaceae bacterium]
MNDLQLALIGFGVFLVAAVWAYNFWQERKYRSQAEKVLPPGTSDVLMAGRTEDDGVPDAAGMAVAVPREPTLDVPVAPPVATEESSGTPPSHVPEFHQSTELPSEWADGRADCLVRIEFVDAQPVAGLWAEQADWSGQIDKPLQWLGLDEKSGRWRVLHAQDSGTVAQLAVALQLTDRRGAVSPAVLSAFIAGIHRLARRFSGLADLPDAAEVQARAAELDAFCAAVDLQLSLHVVPRSGSIGDMVGARLAPVIATAALQREGERLVAVDGGGNEAFSLTCQTTLGDCASRIDALALTGLTFSLDVPRVEEGAAAFTRMVGLARQCAEALGGQLADAHGQPLADATLDAIRGRIDELQAKMARMAIPAGSVRALRLFS